MDYKELFKKYRNRLVLQGALNSLFWGLCVGLAAAFIAAFVTWFTTFEGLWLAVGLGVGVSALAGVAFYFFKFRPSDKEIAERLDRLGLEERVITMRELAGDDSYMARRQREDAMEKISSFEAKNLKIILSRLGVIMACVVAVLAISMTTVEVLTKNNILKPPVDPPGYLDPEDPENYVCVTYMVGEYGGGYIAENPDQIILKGADAETVVAIADDGWMFQYWLEDENENPSRTDRNITEDTVFTAVFSHVGEPGDGDGDGEGSEGDEPNDGDSSGEPSDGDGQQGEQQQGPQQGEQQQGQQGEQQQSPPGQMGQDGPGGGAHEEVNQIIDNNHYYRDEYDQYRQDAKDKTGSGENIGDEAGEIVDSYFNGIH